MSELESLEAITFFRFSSDDVQNLIDKLGTFSIMTLGPVVTCKINGLCGNPIKVRKGSQSVNLYFKTKY
jgi:hypothetical protein